jgi:hypothetical protein
LTRNLKNFSLRKVRICTIVSQFIDSSHLLHSLTDSREVSQHTTRPAFDYIWTATDNALFESGKKYELHLLVGKDVVQGGAISAKPWGEETITEKETD